jgi:hypothetical protein
VCACAARARACVCVCVCVCASEGVSVSEKTFVRVWAMQIVVYGGRLGANGDAVQGSGLTGSQTVGLKTKTKSEKDK